MSLHSSAVKPSMQPPKSGIKVRMYNPGFGDCLLLAFRAKNNKACYMLIDCGVHHQYPEGQEKMKLIAEDIGKATGNHLNIVVVTHEHTDHLYGFKYARDIFDNIEIDDLWLAWTENPKDPIAKQLKDLYGIRIRALTEAVNQLRLAQEPLGNEIQRVLDFEFHDVLTAAGSSSNDQLEYLRAKSIKKLQRKEDYRSPEEAPLSLPDVKGIKIYILGPPKNVDWIKKLEKKSELYPMFTEMNETTAFAVAALASSGYDSLEGEEKQLFRLSCPFDEILEIKRNKAQKHLVHGQFFQEYYGFSSDKGHGPKWRRIDTDWLASAEQLALKINAKTNNTSLVLAIELTETQPKKVLLFAADAQVGNWLSWHQLLWHDEEQSNGYVTVADLLKRTVLYKVGHHGSRNATLSWKGLEMMESPDLVAMIPVDQNWANNKMHWEHPAEKLLDRLMEKTRGRIIRIDDISSGDESPEKPDEASTSEWETFIKQLEWDNSKHNLWIQYTVLE